MKESKLQKKLTETLSQIDGAMAALDAYPDLEDAILSRVQNEANKFLGKIFPTQLDFSKEILEHLVGTDKLIEIISEFITVALPEVEISLKAALLANMNNLGSECTIDPIIYEKAIKEGIVFDLRQIDLIDKLTISPLDKKLGQYYYFGIDGCESAYDVLQSAISPNNQTEEQQAKNGVKQKTSYLNQSLTNSIGHYFGGRKRDFDCLLWYMKNKAAYREVWGKRTTESEDIFNNYAAEDPIPWLNKKGSKKSSYYRVDSEGKIAIYTYNKGWSHSADGKIDAVKIDKTYEYLDGNTHYGWFYGNPTIKKVSRKKYYRVNESVYFYDGTKWDSIIYAQDKYNTINDVPTTIKKGDTFFIGNDLYIITKDPETDTKTKTSTDKYGKKTTVTTTFFKKSLEYSVAIDVRDDVTNNSCMFVDYEMNNNKQKIKDGSISDVVCAFGCSYKDVQKTWTKAKLDNVDTSESNPNLYYVEVKDKPFDIQTSQILITPYVVKDGNAEKCVNITNAMEEKCKYTKDFGVVTLEYSPRTGNVKQSDGNPLQQQTPYDNVLHVFFGNVKELPNSDRSAIQESLKNDSDLNKMGATLLNKLYSVEQTHKKLWKEWVNVQRTNNKDIKRKSGTEIDIVETKENQEYKKAYYALEKFRLGDEKEVKTNLTAQSKCFQDVSQLKAALNAISDVFDKYFEKVKDKVTNSDGTVEYIETDSYGYKNNNTFSFETVKEYAEEMFDCLKEYSKSENEGDIDFCFSVRAFVKRIAQIVETDENLLYLSAKDVQYPEAKKNYYLKRTLFEFNADYINSLQLFDSKVLAAQLITSLFGGVTLTALMGLTANWKTELIRDTVKDMVEKTIASQDYSVSDCFFTFTNDAYNGMLRAAELRQAGLYSKSGEENGNSTINPISLLSGLNNLNDAADQSEQISIIKGTIMSVSEEVSRDSYTESNSFGANANFGVQMSFIETLMTNLCTQVVMAMLSPKVYLLILINLQMFGMTTNFDLKSFLQNFQNLIVSLIKSVVDKFMEYISAKIMELVEDLVSKLTQKLALEQAEMYMRLLKQIFQHFRALTSCGDGAGWTQDIVGSADIVQNDTQETTDEC